MPRKRTSARTDTVGTYRTRPGRGETELLFASARLGYTGVWLRDERNKKPLAVGISQMSADEMINTKSGKAVKTIHYIGDKIWKLSEE